MKKCWLITTKLWDARYVDYIERAGKNDSYASHSLTRTFSDICIKAGCPVGVDYYLKYMSLTDSSVEEERALDLERLFVRHPEAVLKRIGTDEPRLDDLVYGFIMNRNYGPKNPYEKEDYSAETFYKNGPKPVLNRNNCRKIFFETNPTLVCKYDQYKYQIDYKNCKK